MNAFHMNARAHPFTFFLVESMKNARHNTVKLYLGAKKVIHKVLLAKNVAFLGTGCSVLLKKVD